MFYSFIFFYNISHNINMIYTALVIAETSLFPNNYIWKITMLCHEVCCLKYNIHFFNTFTVKHVFLCNSISISLWESDLYFRNCTLLKTSIHNLYIFMKSSNKTNRVNDCFLSLFKQTYANAHSCPTYVNYWDSWIKIKRWNLSYDTIIIIINCIYKKNWIPCSRVE